VAKSLVSGGDDYVGEKYLTPKEAAAALNYKSVRTIYRKLKSGEIKYLETVKGSYRIPVSQFLKDAKANVH
jgi:excisionase family DNA binding protein